MITIRSEQQGDLPAISAIWLEGNCQAHPFIPSAYWLAKQAEVEQALPQAELWLAEAAGEVVGFCGLQEDWLAGIFVRAAWRSQGVGKALLQQAKAKHRQLALAVYAKNQRALQFYLREGFQIQQEGVDEETGEAEYHLVWSKG